MAGQCIEYTNAISDERLYETTLSVYVLVSYIFYIGICPMFVLHSDSPRILCSDWLEIVTTRGALLLLRNFWFKLLLHCGLFHIFARSELSKIITGLRSV